MTTGLLLSAVKEIGVIVHNGTPSESTPVAITAPNWVSASIMSWVSRAIKPPRIVEGPSARAASTNSLLVSDFDPGILNVASSVFAARGQAKPAGAGESETWEVIEE
jgi:hypothetical protein